jgi:hypothetical protein
MEGELMKGHLALLDMAENPGKVYRRRLEEFRCDPRPREGDVPRVFQGRNPAKGHDDWTTAVLFADEILADDWEEVHE